MAGKSSWKVRQSAQGAGGVQGPPLDPIDPELVSADPQQFAANVDGIIQGGSVSRGRFVMPPFGRTSAMSQPQIADAEAYILRLNGVNRALVQSPGVDPRVFFIIVVIGFAAADAASVFGLLRKR